MSSRPPGYPSPEAVSVSSVFSARASRMRVVELAWQAETETCATCAVGFAAGASHLAPGSEGCVGGISLACWTRAMYPSVWTPHVSSSGRRDTEPTCGQSGWIRPLLGSRSGCGNYRPSSPPLMQCAGMLTVWRRPCGGSRRAVGAHRHQHPGSRSSRRASRLQLRSAVIEETSPVPVLLPPRIEVEQDDSNTQHFYNQSAAIYALWSRVGFHVVWGYPLTTMGVAKHLPGDTISQRGRPATGCTLGQHIWGIALRRMAP